MRKLEPLLRLAVAAGMFGLFILPLQVQPLGAGSGVDSPGFTQSA